MKWLNGYHPPSVPPMVMRCEFLNFVYNSSQPTPKSFPHLFFLSFSSLTRTPDVSPCNTSPVHGV